MDNYKLLLARFSNYFFSAIELHPIALAMINFELKRTNRKCSVTQRAFNSGEEYYSVLIDEDGELVRKDIAAEEWDEPPENCVGWWISKVPDLEHGKVYWAPKDVLISYFQYLVDQPDQTDTAYVMAILLLQKKQLRLLDTTTEDEVEWMNLSCNATKEKFTVRVVPVPDNRVAAIQNELAEKLFTDVAPAEES